MNHFIWVNLLSLRLIDTCASYVWLDLTLFIGWQNEQEFLHSASCEILHYKNVDATLHAQLDARAPSGHGARQGVGCPANAAEDGQVHHSPALPIKPPQAGLNIMVQYLQALQLD